jgi:hypothetical protein
MILFITGPSGAGKSTLAAAWVKAQQRDIALIDPDQITSWMRNGDQRAVALAHAEGPVERIAQHYRITGQIYAAAAHVYAAGGVDVVISQLAGFDPPHPWSKGWDRLDALDPIFVVLYPTREVCRKRRIARGSSLDDGSYDFDWPAWQAHPRALFLDNSDLSVDESVAALDALLAQFASVADE